MKHLLYSVDFCLDNETDFADFHPRYQKDINELLLNLVEIAELLDRCINNGDEVVIHYEAETPGKWESLEILGVDGNKYTLRFVITKHACFYIKRNVSKATVIHTIQQLPVTVSFFKNSDFVAEGW